VKEPRERRFRLPIRQRAHEAAAWSRLVSFPVHPVLIGAFPVLALLSANLGQISIGAANRSLLVAVAASALLAAVLWLVLKDAQVAGLVGSVASLLFFSYGHIYDSLKQVQLGSVLLGRHRILLPAAALITIIVLWFGLRRRGRLDDLTKALNLASLLLVLLPAVSIGVFSVRQARVSYPASSMESAGATVGARAGTVLPDIYYIIVDTYPRNDILLDQYGFDNSDFASFLKDRGFYVAARSRANFLFTHLSLTSSLNMGYMQDIAPDYAQGDILPIKRNRVRETLEAIGYSTVGFATGWDSTEWFDADHVLTPQMGKLAQWRQVGSLNRFEALLIPTTALRVLVDLDSLRSTPVAQYVQARLSNPFTVQREIALAEFENLATAPQIPGPKFVFVHILPPHGPHLSRPNGEELEQRGAFTLASKPGDQESADDERFLGEVQYVTKRLREDIDAILSSSPGPVIIILQSDHGPAHNLDWDHPTRPGLKSRISILNAYHLPDGCAERLYPTITPVNSFRLVFSCVLGLDEDLLADRTFYGYDSYIPVGEVIPALSQP
jgi:hypothetical protein